MLRFDELNERQKEAATHTTGPLLIVAGAGAGKTKTLTFRIAHLIESGVIPEGILAVTFTNKAAKEMRERISHILQTPFNPWKEEGPLVKTFHSFAVWFLRREYQASKRSKLFSIIDADESRSMIKEAIVSLGLDPKIHEPRKIQGIISNNKNKCIRLQDFGSEGYTHNQSIISSVWRIYESQLTKENAFDFDDLLSETVRILEERSDVRATYQNFFSHVHIDEYQDTNEVQYRLATLLTGSQKNICVVGDADQTIYTWRGANIKNIMSFEEDFPGSHVVLLEQNYRSTQTIIHAANAIIEKNKDRKDKKLFTEGVVGQPITIIEAYTERRESDLVTDSIEELIKKGVSPNTIAILYRANFQSRTFEESLLHRAIEYRVAGLKFFERKEVKDVLSYIRAAYNKELLTDIRRTINLPARGIGKVTLAKLFAGLIIELPQKTQIKIQQYYELLEKIKTYGDTHTVSELVRFVVEETGMGRELMASGTEQDLERIANMEEVATFAMKYDVLPNGEGVLQLLEDAALVSDQDSLDEQGKSRPMVSLMTVHASKGLEFDHVFVVGLEEGLFPSERDGEKRSNDAEEEERRLFYVAITRARKTLTLTYARMRTIFGQRSITIPSQFIGDIPEAITIWKFDEQVPCTYNDDTYESYINW